MKISHPLYGWRPRHLDTAHFFYCPGCESDHLVYVTNKSGENRPTWTLDGDEDAPTLHPSVLINRPSHRCHLFVRNGQLVYLDDCDHHLAGMTIDMVDLD